MEKPELKYYQTVVDTQTQAHILKEELQDLILETSKYIAWVDEQTKEPDFEAMRFCSDCGTKPCNCENHFKKEIK